MPTAFSARVTPCFQVTPMVAKPVTFCGVDSATRGLWSTSNRCGVRAGVAGVEGVTGLVGDADSFEVAAGVGARRAAILTSRTLGVTGAVSTEDFGGSGAGL